MKLLYTVSSGYMAEQQNVSYSIGGFASSTTIPNDMFGNLFDELSVNTIRNARNEYRAIVLHNDSQEVAKGVKIWFENPETNVCSFKVGAVGMMESEDGIWGVHLIYTVDPIQSSFTRLQKKTRCLSGICSRTR
mgnify:CR=1 FL=1